jgi:MoxR-like ATPase
MQIVQAIANRISANVQKVIIGKQAEIRLTLLALLCEVTS